MRGVSQTARNSETPSRVSEFLAFLMIGLALNLNKKILKFSNLDKVEVTCTYEIMAFGNWSADF